MAMTGARVDVELVAPAEPGAGDIAVVGRAVAPGAWFDVGAARPRPRTPDAVWELVDGRGYNGVHARGRALVHLGRGNRTPRKPVILADAHGHGPSADPVTRLTGDALVDDLLASGYDVVLVGFAERQTYLQANAGALAECVRRAAAERTGTAPLTVGGIGSGGLIARYALALLETDGHDHETDVYLSCDTPHDGAWIPLILQQLAHFFGRFPGAGDRAELLRAPAAQQLLGAWVRDAKYSGPVQSPLRKQFLDDLRRIGDFPRRVRMVGLSCGTGTGVGPPLPAGATAFDWNLGALAAATARFQPDRGTDAAIGTMSALLEVRHPTTTDVPALDGAPGGTAEFFGQVADALGATIPREHRSGCFVPTTSAAALSLDNPQTPVDGLPGPFHEFRCAEENLPHGLLTEPLVRWVLDRLP
ncbi:hypothetical protein UO65_0602 [Actinokineospora spheciospongiae]|uniref:DUF676 domain-containing protein n=2 Tax=Actinokineospora spheciospongiae TaxID=909613 RepID=W7IT70_9PSEU|nr:hypothetical protein UO65_0602 [Actinokineospora spheciospongiae]